MKLNLNYYKEDLNYNKLFTLEYENEIKDKYFQSDNVILSEKDFFNNNEYEIEKIANINSLERNSLEWYEFKKNSSVLEIGARLGGITSLLSEKCKTVTVIEFSKQRGEIISKRLKDRDNIEIIIGKLDDINLKTKKYDYIVLIGILEYAPIFIKSQNPYLDLINYAKSKLKKNGKIILATDNFLGLQYLVGNKCEFNSNVFDSLIDDNQELKFLSKEEIELILKKAKIKNYKFYYPLPNYRFANVIFSDKYMPKANNTKIMYNLIYNNDSQIVLNERKLLKRFIEKNMFDQIANSYLVEISLNKKMQKAKFISYNVLRNRKYNLMLVMDEKNVVKKHLHPESKKHICSIKNNIIDLKKMKFTIIDKYKDDKIISKISENVQFDEYLMNLYNKGKKEQFYSEIEKWYKHIEKKLLVKENFIKKEQNLNFVKKSFIDLVFENTFYDNKKYYFFDQEWMLENSAIEFILYRSLKNLKSYYNIIETFDELLERFNILKNKEKFEKMENILQKKINNEYRINLFSRAYTFNRDIEYKDKFKLIAKKDKKRKKIIKILLED